MPNENSKRASGTGRRNLTRLENLVWSIAEMLRGDYKQSEYGKVVLPFVVLRRLDCILAPTKEAVLKRANTLPEKTDEKARDAVLFDVAGGGGGKAACIQHQSLYL